MEKASSVFRLLPIRPAALVVIFPLVAVAAWSAWDLSEAWRLEKQVSRMPLVATDSEDHDAPLDASRVYAAAAMVVELPDNLGDLTASLRNATLARRGNPQSADQLAAIRVLERNELALSLFRQASESSAKDGPKLTALTTQEAVDLNTPLSALALIASLKTLVLLDNGEFDVAARWIAYRVRSLRHLSAEPRFVSALQKSGALAQIAIDASLIVTTPISTASLVEVRGALQQLTADDDLAGVFQGEDVALKERVRIVLGSRQVTHEPMRWQLFWTTVGRPLVRRAGRQLLEVNDRAVELAQLPWPNRLKELQALRPRTTMLTPPMFPDSRAYTAQYHLVATRVAEGHSLVRTAAFAIAVDLFRRENSRLPESLSEVFAGEMPPIDLFSGQPLRYKKSEGGYTVYSVGANGIDDGGRITKSASPKAILAASDLGFAVTTPNSERPRTDATRVKPIRVVRGG